MVALLNSLTEDGGNKLAPYQVFTVPEEVRYLEPAQVDLWEDSFRCWLKQANKQNSVRSRQRLLCIFLLLRHSGARLSEVLELDVQQNLDCTNCLVFFENSSHSRQVPLPVAVCKELFNFLNLPGPDEPRVFSIDPGYVRRIFYARSKDCGLPKSLGAPRVLRNTRALELLRSGVPTSVVREILGQNYTDLSSIFQRWSSGDICSIVRKMNVERDLPRTSARNTFQGQITDLNVDGLMAEVEISTSQESKIYAIITRQSMESLGLELGCALAATVKAPLVRVSQVCDKNSLRNYFKAKIDYIRLTSVLAEVTGEDEAGLKFCALVSSSSIQELELKEGQHAWFSFKALSVVVHGL